MNTERHNSRLLAFDAFGTIVHYTPSNSSKSAYETLMQEAGIPAKYRRNWRTFLMTHNETESDLRSYIANTYGTISKETRNNFTEGLQKEVDSMQFFLDAPQCLRELAAVWYRLTIISNVAQPFGNRLIELLAENNLTSIIDPAKVILSHNVGIMKPDLKIFNHTAKVHDVPLESIHMIGDSQANDIVWARDAGMQATHIVRNGRDTQREHIKTLNELSTVLNS